MNLAHIHLLLNHFPTVGFAIGLGLLVLAITSKKDELKRASLVVVFLVALITIPTYLSGNAAQSALQEREKQLAGQLSQVSAQSSRIAQERAVLESSRYDLSKNTIESQSGISTDSIPAASLSSRIEMTPVSR